MTIPSWQEIVVDVRMVQSLPLVIRVPRSVPEQGDMLVGLKSML
jgi:hypothetical protein